MKGSLLNAGAFLFYMLVYFVLWNQNFFAVK